MAYMNQETKKRIAPAVKAILKKYGVKGTLAVRHHSTLVLNIKSGIIDIIGSYDRGHYQVNPYYIDEHHTGEARSFLKEVFKAMNDGNHDNSDVMTDYFDVGWYVAINVGQWNKPYICTV